MNVEEPVKSQALRFHFNLGMKVVGGGETEGATCCAPTGVVRCDVVGSGREECGRKALRPYSDVSD